MRNGVSASNPSPLTACTEPVEVERLGEGELL